eukprot:GFUD01017928.1.p1 GENE.GFUD01017928.1~~GFUD01017928.1.p1  ORF type:complete len:622 (-),score=257.62 GFUD01017928.1:219-2084(-)
MATQLSTMFSSDCSKLAMATPDGRLTVWGNGGGSSQLLQQFSPSTHLSAVTTCLAWAPTSPAIPKKKKKKTSQSKSDLVAMGTSAGTVLLYSTIQGDLVTTFKTENSARINSVVWNSSASSLYAAAEEGSVSLFSLATLCLVSTVRPCPGPAHSLALSKDGSIFAIGSRNIVIWDTVRQMVVKTVTGHASPVCRLSIVDNFLFSSSVAERVVSVWSMEGPETGSVLSLGVNQGVADFDLHSSGCQVTAAVVTTEGRVAVFKADLSQTLATTLLPVQTVATTLLPVQTVAIETGRGQPGRIAQARLAVGEEGLLTILYGSVLCPVMEQVTLADLSQSTCLVREMTVTKSGQAGSVSDLVTPRTDGQVVFLAPGDSLGTGQGRQRKEGKRKAEKEEDSLPVEDRLSLLSTQPSPQADKAAPRTDTLAQLLAQGLHSNDTRILDSVLDRADLELIDNTVKRIPAEAVVPLVSVLQKYIKGRGMVNASHAKWLKSVLTVHTGYLVSVPDCQELLTPVYALLETRTQHYNQVLQLRGKLELLTKQAMDRQGDTVVDTEKQALLVYQDESSDELEDVIDDLLVPGSDTDDDWEDEGDAEMEGGEESDDSVEVVNGENGDHDMDSDSD